MSASREHDGAGEPDEARSWSWFVVLVTLGTVPAPGLTAAGIIWLVAAAASLAIWGGWFLR